jgi:hypothetical protein
VDQTLFHLINEQWTNPMLDLFMAAISNINIWTPLIVLLVLYAVIFGGFKGRALVFCVGVALLVNGNLTVSVLKKFVDRRRPKQVQSVRMVELETTRPAFLTVFQQPKIRLFRSARSQSVRPVFPLRPCGQQRDRCSHSHLFLSALGLALFFCRLRHRLVADLSRGALAERRDGDFFLAAGETALLLALLEALYRWIMARWAQGFFVRHPRLVGDAIS